MKIWDAVRRFSGATRPKKTTRTFSGGHGRRDVLGSFRSRNLRMEQFEDRVLLSITAASLEDLETTVCSMDQYTYLSDSLSQSVYSASDLSRYDTAELDATYEWVVGVDSQIDAEQLAASLGADFIAYSPYLENATIWEFSENVSWVSVADTLQKAGDSIDYFYPLVPLDLTLMSTSNDTLFSEQWHLENTGQSGGTAGVDSNVLGAWDYVTGEGVVIGICDDGLEIDHPDLTNNVRTDLSWDFVDNDADPTPSDTIDPWTGQTADNHGTSVGGVAAAEGNNSLGVSGAAPGADLAGLKWDIGGATEWDIANVLTYMNQDIDIYNNSWGYTAYLYEASPQILGAIEQGVTEGRDGLGSIYVFSAGNSREESANTNYSVLTSSRYTITVAAIDHNGVYSSYSTPGASVLISAPSNTFDYASYEYICGIVTTDRTGEQGYNETGTADGDSLDDIDYTSTFGGTSSAAPLVSGIIALILEANPNLTYRDVEYILVNSAEMNDADNPDWVINGAGYHVSNDYGFGNVDATAAVELAMTWENVSEEVSTTSNTINVNAAIPDGSSTGVSSTVTMDDSIDSIEWVEVVFDASHTSPSDLEVTLISPDGTESRLTEANSQSWSYAGDYDHWLLTSCHDWGESSEGEWTLQVKDLLTGTTGTFNSWNLTIYGTSDYVAPEPEPVEVVGPELIAVVPNQGDTIVDGETTLNIAPTELTFQFSEKQEIDPDTITAIQIVRAGGDGVIGNANDVTIEYGWIGIGDRPNEVVVRFAETLPDDLYQITIFGEGDEVLKNLSGGIFHEGENQTIEFTLDLGAQVLAVVPQPTYRDADGDLQQSRDTIEVYFNDDQLDAESATKAEFYRLCTTSETATPSDDEEILPYSVVYDPIENKVTLTFDDDDNSATPFDLADFGTGTFRLRIGNEYREIPTETVDVDVAGDTFATADDLGTLGSSTLGESVIVSSDIAALAYDLQWPGSIEEVGHRYSIPDSIISETHYTEGYTAADDQYGTTVIYYNFNDQYGSLGSTPAYNLITEEQKDRAREIFSLFSNYLGVQFIEDTTGEKGITIVTGDLRLINPFIDTGEGGTLALASGSLIILDNAEPWTDGYGESWFQVAMQQIGLVLGLGYTTDQTASTIMDSELDPFSSDPVYDDPDYYEVTAEDVYPGNVDIIHGQYIYRPDGTDVDVYQFTLDASGTFSAETTAERLDDSSLLDSVLSLYDADGNLLARNDDYYSEDSYLEVQLSAGTYYVVVTSTGNVEYDADVADSGLGGLTQGDYELRLTYRPDRLEDGSGDLHLVDTTGTMFDGDTDGVPGGVYNYWFNVQPEANTLYVDKLADSAGVRGDISQPYANIDDALAAAQEGDIVRIVGNRDRTYDAQETFEVSVNPSATAVGDFDGDGAMDIVVSNEDDDSVSFLFGLGDGTYWNDVTRDVGDQPSAIAVGDLDADGDLDVIVANQGDDTLSILLNKGNGTFSTQMTQAVNAQPSDLALVDLNGDGLLDIIVTSITDGTVSVLLSGATAFSYGQTAYVVGAAPSAVDVADLDNDGYLDLAVANRNSNNVVILLNDKNGAFTEVAASGLLGGGGRPNVGQNPSDLRIEDIDGDGNRDLVVANAGSDNVSVLLGYGDGSFAAPVNYAVGDQPTSLGVADLDQDGNLDFVTANQGSDTVSVFFGLGDGTFEADATYATGDSPTGLTLADVDGDDRPDIITANYDSEDVSVLLARRDEAYLIGLDENNKVLEDGSKMEVPKGVTVMIDAGAVLKLSGANIDVGSSSLNLDRSEGSLQILGTPDQCVYLTSYYDKSLGSWDTDQAEFDLTANGGDWGGLVFRNDLDYTEGRTVLETEGIFLNYVNGAEIRYGGGTVRVNGVKEVYNPIHMIESRPTITYNTILYSADAAMSADPNSFADTKFQGSDYSANYDRVGPDIHGNTLIDNTSNGIFIRIDTEAGQSLDELTVCARWDDLDIVHIVAENLIISGTSGGAVYDGNEEGDLTARLDARLTIDPGIIVKLDGSRIETEMGAQLIAEGTAEQPIIFTSLADDSYGAGGTFDTGNNEDSVAAEPGDWGGLYFAPTSTGSIDHAYIAYGGGETRVAGGFADFNTIEIHQADVRLANSTLAHNTGATTEERVGRPAASASVIFVRGAQPVIINNVIRDNEVAAISINANSLVATQQGDTGRSTGFLDASEEYPDNYGPLVRDNQLANNAVNGMVVRGEVLSIDCVWDDTDIVHVVYDEIVVPNFHTYGGLRLQSAADESLVVKFYGENAGLTALGTPQEIEDRIGGTLQIIGQPGYPVVLTSLADDSVGAGVDPWGEAQLDTDNADNTPSSGDWRSIKLEEYVNDCNVAVILETEEAYGDSDDNDLPIHAQEMGELAPDDKSGDDNLRLGFDVYGFIQSNDSDDVDVYSFSGRAGTEVWIDIDRTTLGLDSIIELVDAEGNVIASSDNSTAEGEGISSVYGDAQTMNLDAWDANSDMYTTNIHDAGMRVVLPGVEGTLTTYYIQVRSADGKSSGAYELQVRLSEDQQIAGSTVQYSSIRYATNGIELIGLPTNSPLLVDVSEIEGTVREWEGTMATADIVIDDIDNNDLTVTANVEGTAYNDVYIYAYDLGTTGDTAEVTYDPAYDDNGTIIKVLFMGITGDTTANTLIAAINAEGTFTASLLAESGNTNDGTGLIGYTGVFAITAGGTDSGNEAPDNNTFATAEYIGNLLDSDDGVLKVSGELTNTYVDGETVYDIDWYSFALDAEKVSSSTTGGWTVTFDIDYADGMARPNTSLYVYDSTGTLIYQSASSNIAEDQFDPLAVNGIEDLTRGSAGTADPYIGPVLLPEGDGQMYYVAVVSVALVPEVLDEALVRIEPVNSVIKVAEDNIDTIGASGTAEGPYDVLFTDTVYKDEVNLHVDDYQLNDVVMYVTVNGGTDVYTFDPFTGEYETDVTGALSGYATPSSTVLLPGATSIYYYGDIDMRSDGQLDSFVSSSPASDATQDIYIQLSTEDGTQVSGVANEITTYMPNPEDPDDLVVADVGVQISAMIDVVEDSVRYIYAIGHVEGLAENLLFKFDEYGQVLGASGDALYTSVIPWRVLDAGADTPVDGKITGLDFVDGTLYGITDTGKLYEINGYSDSLANVDIYDEDDDGVPPVWTADNLNLSIEEVANLNEVFPEYVDQDTGVIAFSGLTIGPANVESEAYSMTLFATDTEGNFYAMQLRDTDPVTGEDLGEPTWLPNPVFLDGQSVIILGITDPNTGEKIAITGQTGVAFSNIDYNLWHITDNREEDDGHDINITPDNTRSEDVGYPLEGGSSFWFGFEDGFYGETNEYASDDPSLNTYDVPGGTYGTLTTDTFSLAGYSAADSPYIYFDYYLETDGGVDTNIVTDSARVYISNDGATWELLATNIDTPGDIMEDDSAPFLMEDGTGVWCQAKISLADYAGMDNLQLKFEFSTAASTNIDATYNMWTGVTLRTVDGDELLDGDTFELLESVADSTVDHFEFDMGYSLVVPNSAGMLIEDGETFMIVNEDGDRFTFEFDKDNQVTGDNIAILISDEDPAYEIAQAMADAINSVSVKTVLNPFPPLSDVTAWVSGDRVYVQGAYEIIQSDDPTIVREGTAPGVVNYRYVQVPELEVGSNVRILDGETITIEDAYGNIVTFEFDKDESVAAGNIAVTYLDNGRADEFDSGEVVAQALLDAIQQAVADGLLVDVVATLSDRTLTLTGTADITQSVDLTAPADDLPIVQIEDTILVPINAGMTAAEVAAQIGAAMDGYYCVDAYGNTTDYGTLENENLLTSVKVNQDLIHVLEHLVVDPGKLAYSDYEPGNSVGTAAATQDSAGTQFNQNLRGQDNAYEGWYVDNLTIGFAERGEMITDAVSNTNFNTLDVLGVITEGYYQLEIRVSTEYAQYSDYVSSLLTAYDTNDRHTEEITLVALPAGQITHGDSFTISDGQYSQVFTFVDTSLPYDEVEGVIYIAFQSGETADEIAVKMTSAINSAATIDVTASNILTSERVNLNNATSVTGSDKLVFDQEGQNPTDVSVADFNADGYLDVVTVNEYDGTVSVSMQVASPFQTIMDTAVQYEVGNLPSAVEVADVNGDGLLDIITSNAGDDTVSILLGNPLYVEVYRYVTVPRLDPENQLPIVDGETFTLFDEKGNKVRFEFDSNGSVKAGNIAISFVIDPYSPDDIAQAMMDAINQATADGLLVDVVATITDNRLRLQGVEKTQQIEGGKLEFVKPTNYISSDTSYAFEEQMVFSVGNEPADLVIADLDADGRLDIITANKSDNTISILYGNGDGTFKTYVTMATGSVPTSVEAGDLNGDGVGDIIVTNSTDNTVSVFLSISDTVYADPVTYTVGNLPVDVELADLDGSGSLDIVTANRSEGTVSILLGNGNGTFASALHYDVGASVVDVEIEDLNGDGILDLATANHATNSVHTLFGTGDSENPFLDSTLQEFSTSTGPMGIAIADMNNDGLNDLVTADYWSHTFTLNVNSGGAFSIQVSPEYGVWDVGPAKLRHIEGDDNQVQTQGQVIIACNEILYSAEYGIKVDAGERDYESHPSSAGTLAKVNSEDLVSGLMIENNLIVASGIAGILFSGDPNEEGADAATLFGRIVNNTIYGGYTSIELLEPGDIVLEPNDDGSTDLIDIGFELNFYGNTYTQMYVNNNGNITFEEALWDFVPEGFPQNTPIIAPFWADVDTWGVGEVRVAYGTSSSGNPVVQIDWINVGYFSSHTDKTNTFTLYIEDDPAGDIVVFVYHDMQWTTGDIDGSGGFGGEGAQIGFDAGDQENYVSVARPNSLSDLEDLMNTGTYVWRLSPDTGVPFGGSGSGIVVTENASPTILNNIIANTDQGIVVDDTCSTTVIGANVYQNNSTNTVGITPSATAIFVDPDEQLFVDPDNGNFYPAAGSSVIDSSIDSLEDRAGFVEICDPLGISESPILSPDLDLYGQLRSDDPDAQPPSGVGNNVYKDRGAIDRVDFSAPKASVIDPMDNDSAGVDRDSTVNSVFVIDEPLPVFSIQLTDNSGGIGIYDYSVTPSTVQIFKDDSTEPLVLDTDYYFYYDSGTDVITLVAARGLWDEACCYRIVLNNSEEEGITDIAGNPLRPNRLDGSTTFYISIDNYDYGDAPDPDYPSTLENDGARHLLIGDLYLGDGVSGEADARLAKDDNGDFLDEATGDTMDDGVSFTSALLLGDEVTMDVKASVSGGSLDAWLDLNGDGDFDDDGEHVIVGEALSRGWNEVSFVLPAEDSLSYDIALGETVMRFRLTPDGIDSNGDPIGPTGEAVGGEVEDYDVVLVDTLKDFGDAPAPYPTLLADNGAVHELVNDLYLGAGVDQELDGQPDEVARGDDTHGIVDATGDEPVVIDDEDGVQFPDYFVPGNTVEVIVTASATGYLNAWIDFNGDGVWTADEKIADGLLLMAGENTVSFTVPAEATVGETFARFRFSSEMSLEPTGSAIDGEVEDYRLLITDEPSDYGDAPLSYSTVEMSEPATAQLILSGRNNDMLLTAVTLGTEMNDIDIIITNKIATGNEAIVTFDEVKHTFTIDVDPQHTTANTVVAAINSQAPAVFTAELNDLADSGNDGTGLLTMTGKVAVTAHGTDGFGEDAARHLLSSDLYLGASVDTEFDGQPDNKALGDDKTDLDDEDGVALPDKFTAGTTSTIAFTVHIGDDVTGEAKLYGWIDFDQDGTFTEDEQILFGETVVDGLNYLTVSTPVTALAGKTFARFRLSTDDDLSFDGVATDGEIEDYQVQVTRGTAAIKGWVFDDSDSDGQFDSREDGLSGVLVYLDSPTSGTAGTFDWQDTNDNGTFDPGIDKALEPYAITLDDNLATTDVDETGYYEFTGLVGRLTPYTVRFDYTTLAGWASTSPDHTVVFADGSHGNDDHSYTISLDEGEIIEEVNFGNYRLPTVIVENTQVVEGNSGYTEVQVTLRLVNSFGTAVEVNYTTENGSAVNGVTGEPNDYLTKSGTLVFDPQSAPAATWDVQVLTSTETNEYDYGVSGKYVVWEGFDGNDWEIYLFESTYDADGVPIITQLTDNDTDDHFASLCATDTGVNVAWTGYDEVDGDLEVFLYESNPSSASGTGSRITQLTDNYYDDHDPQVSADLVTWWGDDAGDNEIFVVDIATIGATGSYDPATQVINLSDNEQDDRSPIISGRNIVWTGLRGTDNEIFVYYGENEANSLDEPNIIQVTDNSRIDQAPQIDGNKVVWEAKVGTTYEIFLYDMETGETTQITSNSREDRYPQISGEDVVWQGYDGADWEIYHYNTIAQTAPENISNNSFFDEDPQIEGSQIVWRVYNNSNWEIYYYDLDLGGNSSNISNSAAIEYNPQVSEDMVMWRAFNGESYEIFVATRNIPEVTQTVTLRIVGDKYYEGDEVFYLHVAPADPELAYVENDMAEILILNDDGTLDFGDAPETDTDYPTTLANNGARHQIVAGVYLGSSVDSETNGKPTIAANGDDTSTSDDEDGIVFNTALVQGSTASITVTASMSASDPYGYLDAWIDFNGDGDWDDTGEHILNGEIVVQGENQISFSVPSTAVIGETYARFRYNTISGGLDYTGNADNGEVEDYLVEIVEQPISDNGVITLMGTNGDDVFHFYAGDTLRIEINGAVFEYPAADIDQILFDGGKGNDKVYFHGTAEDESAELWPTRGLFNGPQGGGYLVDATNVEWIQAEAYSGNDTLTLHDSAANDTLVGHPTLVTLTGMEFELRGTDYASVLAVSSAGGTDTANLYGADGSRDTFTGRPRYGQMADAEGATPSYSITVDGFRYISAFSGGDASDRAYLYDSVGYDELTATPTSATLAGDTFELNADGFRYVTAYSENGGDDKANLFDSAGNDTLVGRPDYVRLTDNTSYTITADHFRRAAITASAGGTDSATLYDSIGEDTLEAGPTYAKLLGAYEPSGGGAVVSYSITANYFDTVRAYGNAGGNDVAQLSGSAGDDYLLAGVDTMMLSGPGYNISFSDFQHVVGFAGTGGYDVADFYGTNGDDVLTGTPSYSKLVSDDRSFRAYGFDEVRAWGGEGHDEAYWEDSVFSDLLEADTQIGGVPVDWARLSYSSEALNYLLWAGDFEYVLAQSTSSGDKKDVSDEAAAHNYLFTTGMWEDL